MSTAQGSFDGASSPGAGARWANPPWSQQWSQHSGRGSCGAGRWSPFEIAAVILGFVVFWPVGLAMLGFKLWQRAVGHTVNWQSAAAAKWQEARSAMEKQGFAPDFGGRPGRGGPRGPGFYGRDTGNAAFDEWRAQEIARLEEERRKLEEARQEFSAFVDTIRKAKDREEFERFMSEKRNKPAGGTAERPGPAS